MTDPEFVSAVCGSVVELDDDSPTATVVTEHGPVTARIFEPLRGRVAVGDECWVIGRDNQWSLIELVTDD